MNFIDERRSKDLCVFAKILIKKYSDTKTRQYCNSFFHEGVSARTWLTPFLVKSELMLYKDTLYQDLHFDI